MNSEGGPKTAPTNAPTTVPRNPDLERWLITTALDGLLPEGMVDGFVDMVLARLDEHGADIVTDVTSDRILGEVEEEALDMAGWLLLLAYQRPALDSDAHVHSLLSVVRCAASGYYAARRIRLGSEHA